MIIYVFYILILLTNFLIESKAHTITVSCLVPFYAPEQNNYLLKQRGCLDDEEQISSHSV